MNWDAVRILYLRELRSALRERTIVVNSILMPIFLYPVLLWVMFSAITFVQGVNDGFTSRVGVVTPAPDGHEELLDSLAARSGIRVALADGTLPELPPLDEDGNAPPPAPVQVMDRELALQLLTEGELDAVLAFTPPAGAADELPSNFGVSVSWDRAENRSGSARDRIESVVDAYRERWTNREADALGLTPPDRIRFEVVTENVASSDDLGAMLLGQMVSFFVIIMVALGCFTPSVDTTAGERERSTWETLMTVAAPRSAVVVAKYLYVATLGIVAGILNVVALFVSVGAIVQPLLAANGGGRGDLSFAIPPAAIPVMLAGAVALALFFAAAMMILAAFARTFKDGQAMVQPVYYLVFLPFLLGQQNDMTLTPAVASIPVANISMMIRDAMKGVFIWPLIAQTLAVTLGLVVVCLLAARFILRFEDFLMGSFDGSFWRFAKDRMGKGRREKTAA